MYKRLLKLINARYSVPTWLWAIASLAAGLIIFIGSIVLPDEQIASDPFLQALPLNGIIWGALLTFSGLANMFGMATGRVETVRWTAFLNFCLWIFGTIAFASTGLANVAIYAGPMLVFWAYKYLASYARDYPRL